MKDWGRSRKKTAAALALALCLSGFGGINAFAEGGFAIPGQESSSQEVTETAPSETALPESSAAPSQNGEDAAAPSAEPETDSGFTMPGKPQATETPTQTAAPTEAPAPTAAPSVTEPPKTDAPTAEEEENLSDAEYMKKLTVAFMDGITEITPDHPKAHFQAVMVRAASRRMGSAQWFVDGAAHGDYYSSEFPIYNGRITGMEMDIPFDRETENREITVALEVHLNGEVRRIEKTVQIVNYDEAWYNQKLEETVHGQVKPVEIEATVRYWTQTYANQYLGGANGSLGEGSRVIYCDHYGTSAAKIWIPEENRGCWVPYASVRVSDKDYTVKEDFSDEVKEAFVNLKGYESSTDYLIWVNLERQRVNVFQGHKGNWDLIFASTCSSGKNTTPTPAGVMTYCAYGDGWFHPTYYVKPVMYLNLERGIALHSILFNPNGTVQDGTQGTPVSHGCVRMPADKIRYLADHIPVGTTTVVY